FIAIAAGPSTTKAAHFRSIWVTCLISPPRVSSLAVVRVAACSSVSSRTVHRRTQRALASPSSRSARSPVAAGAAVPAGAVVVGVVPVIVVSVIALPLLVFPGRFPAHRGHYGR